MGNVNGPPAERPVHRVQLRHPFAVAKYEVPQNLWKAVMGTEPSRWPGPRNSVEQVSFPEVLEFCERSTKLMRRAGLITDRQVVRLPSEAEWEYVVRAGTATRYSFGDETTGLDDCAWYAGNAAGNDPPVGAKRPNDWGLYDAHGYLWEWCLDPPHASYESAPTDGSAWTAEGTSGQRVLRGGSWKDRAEMLTSSFRRFAPETLKDDAVGFRCVLAEQPARSAGFSR